jgi:uncharacterized protein
MQKLVFILIIILIIIWIFLNWYQSKLLFNPIREHVWSPNIPYLEFYLNGLNGWYFNNYPDNKTILHCHCNYGNISYLKETITMADRQQLNLIVFDYYGYGKSVGKAHPNNIYKNGEDIYKYLTEELRVSPNKIIVWGESLGGAVATHIASKYECSNLVLLATFASLNDLFVDTFPRFSLLAQENIMKSIFYTLPSKDKIRGVNSSIAIIHSIEDKMIPISNARKMYNSIEHENKLFIEIKGEHWSPNIKLEQLEQLFNFCNTDTSRCCYVKDILEEIAKRDVN